MATNYPENAIAVIGMACKFPGADSLEEYWDILHEGKSMCQEVPEGRFATRNNARSQEKSVYLGNFLEDVDKFDHKFFRKSSREAASMDPQQRLLLEVAYRALESSGYWNPATGAPGTNVGCYIGVCASDYNDNTASHPPNAFSTLGTLRAFLSGKISHFFGWTSASVTFDTACSSSAVAIDSACKAIQTGSCDAAVAGGVSIFTSPYFFQNLSAASFLSQTGATKSFDAGADGYCRGEGVGLVVLKKLSKAVADGDNILGTLLSTAVRQSSNLVPITVPYPSSQASLYRAILSAAKVHPNEITYLEAHGTGTRIGDPQEVEGIKEVFGGHDRRSLLHFASVKGNIGHTEGASGVAGLIKTLLMMQKRTIPPQASFKRVNPKIALDHTSLAIPNTPIKWDAKVLTACVNNYGAAGSIAAMVIQEAASPATLSRGNISLSRYPVIICANSSKSICDYATKLREFIPRQTLSAGNVLGNLAFNLSRKQNRTLPQTFATTVSSMSELDDQLRILGAAPSSPSVLQIPKAKPLVLAFGGQTNRFVGLCKEVYDSSALLRFHLDECDSILLSLGCKSIYPGIFETEPRDDVVALQTMQFALQYASARAWLRSGLQVDAVLGHSFGQLVALTISGVLSLSDGLKLVHGRALLMHRSWDVERGAMVALDATLEATRGFITSLKTTNPAIDLEIACYNGPKSQVIVGSMADVDEFIQSLDQSAAVKYKKLNVTHGFHSKFADSILPELEELAQSLEFNEPQMNLVACSEHDDWSPTDPKLIAEHTRAPVYFGRAVQRIAQQLGPCTWLEAGSNSSVISMVRRAVDDNSSVHSFFPINMGRKDAMGSLADTTVNLWRSGHHTQFWMYHPLQAQDFEELNLPPYQFERTLHWLEWKEPNLNTVQTSEDNSNVTVIPDQPPRLITIVGSVGQEEGEVCFSIDTKSDEWKHMVEGHAVLGNPLCPAPLYFELASRAISQLLSSKFTIHLEALEILSSIGSGKELSLRLHLKPTGRNVREWSFACYSNKLNRGPGDVPSPVTTATGLVAAVEEGQADTELRRMSRLLAHSHVQKLLREFDGEAMQGSLIYRVFSRVVQYSDYYKGINSIVAKDGAVAAEVALDTSHLPWTSEQISNPIAVDNFLQVAGLHVNSLRQCADSDVFVCTRVDQVYFSPSFTTSESMGRWRVFSTLSTISEKVVENDVYVFDSTTETLVFVVLGAQFSRVLITSLAKVLTRANNSGADINDKQMAAQISQQLAGPAQVASQVASQVPKAEGRSKIPPLKTLPPVPKSSNAGLEKKLRQLLGRITDIPEDEFKTTATLDDLGIDSLMVTEIVSEVSSTFNVDIPQDALADLSTFGALLNYLSKHSPLRISEADFPAPVDTEPVAITFESTPVETTLSAEGLIQLAQLVASHLDCPSSEFQPQTNLADQGLDSLLCMELASDIEKSFNVKIDVTLLTTESTFQELSAMVFGATIIPEASSASSSLSELNTSTDTDFEHLSSEEDSGQELDRSQAAFSEIQHQYETYARETGFIGFWKFVYPKQAQLVLSYVVEAFDDLNCSLEQVKSGQVMPLLPILPKHHKLRDVLYEILRDGGLVDYTGMDYVRSEKPVPKTSSGELYAQIISDHPQHAKELQLLDLCGSILSQLLDGRRDPLQLLFGTKKNKELLEDVYSTGPMYLATSRLLGSFLEKALSPAAYTGRKIHILELGAGTGATTRWVIETLLRAGVPFTYTFTDISTSLVAAAKRKFAKYDFMEYMVLNIEKPPPEKFYKRFGVVLSTNCIHATSNLPRSLRHIHQMVQPGGFVSLVEFTKNMFWFDLVFGLLEGWWLFNDGREHVLADEAFWEQSMRGAGFEHVAMTDGSTKEAKTVRIITAFTNVAKTGSARSWVQEKFERTAVETVAFDTSDKDCILRADLHYPLAVPQALAGKKWPVALCIHGGGHVMLSREDIRPKQIQHLLRNGILPISVDYRLCPEVTIVDGPMKDVRTAYEWVRTKLASLKLKASSVLDIDTDRVAVVGWSTGGTLALSLSWTTAELPSVKLPDVVLAFYCPTDYHDDFWKNPNIPRGSENYMSESNANLLEGVRPRPITSYNVPPSKRATGGWMCPSDPRSNIILHMNWRGQMLPVLWNGLPTAEAVSPEKRRNFESLPLPSSEEIKRFSPLANIESGAARAPTYLVHGTEDDLIPWQQSVRTYEALQKAGITSGISILQGQPHLFDLFSDATGENWRAVEKAYDFVLQQLNISF